MKLLIDGDIVCYRAAFATEKTKYCVIGSGLNPNFFENAADAKSFNEKLSTGEIWTRKEVQPEDQALMIASVMIKDIYDRYASENPSVVVYLTGSSNFRNGIATRATYKDSRGPRPVHLPPIRKYLISKGALVSEGEEADDAIARDYSDGDVVATVDKDFNQLAARLYNFVKKEEVTINKKEASLNFFAQVLSGDPTDSIPGLTGVGPVKARKALDGCKNALDCWQVCINLYTAEFGDVKGPEYALECARLIKIGQPKGVLWMPPVSTIRLGKSK